MTSQRLMSPPIGYLGRMGEKGAVLARLANLGCPVPDGFVITSPPSTISHNRLGLSDSLKKEIDEHLRRLENKTGRHFFAADADGVISGKPVGEGCFPFCSACARAQSSPHPSSERP